jgi:schlafen family protein
LPAYYRRTVEAFLQASPSEVLGELTGENARFGFAEVDREAIEAWQEEIICLRDQLAQLCQSLAEAMRWGLLLEFPIPRRQRRIDAVLLAGELIFVLEFKSGASGAAWSSGQQAEDYALDLAYFHAPSHHRVIIPVVVAPGLPSTQSRNVGNNVRSLGSVPPEELSTFLRMTFQAERRDEWTQISSQEWDEGAYEPVPTVIEAAMALYAGMSVREIARSHAGEENLTSVTDFLLSAVRRAQEKNEKVICFVTGIPGAGKTLAGLNLVHNRAIQADGRPASVFMSGNGPLVDILREALAIDSAARNGKTLGNSRKEVKTFVQNIHHFVKDNLDRPVDQTPYENAIVFDEAQRAWNAEQNIKKYKKRPSAWHIPEPEMVLRIMDRHKDWAAIVALVGGGQEIHDGEAGLSEWGRALANYPHWRVFASPEALSGGESVAGASLFGREPVTNRVDEERTLHLSVCIRSHQATELATWVNSVLRGNETAAKELSTKFEQFPIVLTRDLTKAKEWLLGQARGERRCGLVASSGATRLRAFGIETSMAIREAYSYPYWFLKPRGDIRSSYQLEVVATEFEIQGLELDLVGLCWGGDLVWDRLLKCWHPLQLSGNKWKDVKESRAIYIKNKYRVLMTRAREGLVIWVPEGDSADPTRDPAVMNETAEYLIRCGVVPLI